MLSLLFTHQEIQADLSDIVYLFHSSILSSATTSSYTSTWCSRPYWRCPWDGRGLGLCLPSSRRRCRWWRRPASCRSSCRCRSCCSCSWRPSTCSTRSPGEYTQSYYLVYVDPANPAARGNSNVYSVTCRNAFAPWLTDHYRTVAEPCLRGS